VSTSAPPQLDPITFAVARNALQAAARIGINVLRRTTMSPVLYEMQDYGVSLYDQQLNLIGEAAGSPMFTGALDTCIERTLDSIGGAATLRPGDIVVNNHPHAAGAQIADTALIEPAFLGEQLVGYCAVRAHMGDMGAISYYPTDTTDIFQEGLILDCVRLYDRGQLNEAVLRIIRANSRRPEITAGNVLASASALRATTAALIAAIERLGLQTHQLVVDEALAQSEQATRDAVAQLRDGVYTAEGALGDNGVELGVPVPIRVAVTIDGSNMTVDTSGSAPQQRGPVNCPLAYTQTVARLALKCLVRTTLPTCGGEFRPLTVVAPVGSIFNPDDLTAPCNQSFQPALQLFDLVLYALAQAQPEALPAMNGGSVPAGTPSIRHPVTGTVVHAQGNGIGVGLGATFGADGADAVSHPLGSNLKMIPTEVHEQSGVLLRRRLELIPDSGGPGRWRGGIGVRAELEFLGSGTADWFVERSACGEALGLAGGRPSSAPNSATFFLGADGEIGPLGKRSRIPIKPGDTVVVSSAGGGGWGDPLERDAQAVARDVADGYVTADGARDDYGVVIRDDGTIDAERTTEVRASRPAH
jgi:N-methylhydantoinase B